MFTRGFRLAFRADPCAIRKWISDSNGTRRVKPSRDGDYIRYLLSPRHGYQYADVLVDTERGTVKVYLSWS